MAGWCRLLGQHASWRGISNSAWPRRHSSTAPSSITRFLDKHGSVHLGELDEDGQSATLVDGCVGADPCTWLASPSRGPVLTGTTIGVTKTLCPVPTPPAILCIGLNYKKHAAETGLEPPRFPVVFYKNPASVAGPDDDIVIPRVATDPPELDYECELAVIIGPRPAKNVSVENALDYVLGYTAANDVSARRWQGKRGGSQWCRSKSFDTFCPLGPRILLAKPTVNPDDLKISTRVNGDTLQSSSTNDMIFSVAELIAFLSESTTLLPGTVILTGTPEGVGFARKPPIWLKPGDEVSIEIEDIGVLRNKLVLEAEL